MTRFCGAVFCGAAFGMSPLLRLLLSTDKGPSFALNVFPAAQPPCWLYTRPTAQATRTKRRVCGLYRKARLCYTSVGTTPIENYSAAWCGVWFVRRLGQLPPTWSAGSQPLLRTNPRCKSQRLSSGWHGHCAFVWERYEDASEPIHKPRSGPPLPVESIVDRRTHCRPP